jgi:hypothetical protein
MLTGIDMELLQGICVEVSNPLCCNASSQSVFSSLPEQSLDFFAAIPFDTSSISQISDKLLSFIKYKQDIRVLLEIAFFVFGENHCLNLLPGPLLYTD